MSNIKEYMNAISKALKEDEGYYIGWQSNIAMAAYDEIFCNADRHDGKLLLTHEELHEWCNNAAKNFLDLLIRE